MLTDYIWQFGCDPLLFLIISSCIVTFTVCTLLPLLPFRLTRVTLPVLRVCLGQPVPSPGKGGGLS
ncbi:hypothetical protein CDL12_26963 [Handroanthus impetiginosus]|uniref:Uncharacterized protein n=1 Tax=Handroanthus impetiginosus TaxID=429701 RepID=A0A2G9G5X0_9LAMI|nr:hypothetical protein CDL12_26963 [Handroanthus impetiginosus]